MFPESVKELETVGLAEGADEGEMRRRLQAAQEQPILSSALVSDRFVSEPNLFRLKIKILVLYKGPPAQGPGISKSCAAL